MKPKLKATYVGLVISAIGIVFLVALINLKPLQTIDLVSLVTMYEKRLAQKQYEIDEREKVYEANEERNRKYVDERCVCIPWNSSSNEPALSEKEICK